MNRMQELEKRWARKDELQAQYVEAAKKKFGNELPKKVFHNCIDKAIKKANEEYAIEDRKNYLQVQHELSLLKTMNVYAGAL